MSWVRFSAAVALTSLALVAVVVAVGGFAVGNAVASNVPIAAMQAGFGGDFKGQLPPQLAWLKDVPADQRFAHFKGVQVNLTDKDGLSPLTHARRRGQAEIARIIERAGGRSLPLGWIDLAGSLSSGDDDAAFHILAAGRRGAVMWRGPSPPVPAK